MGIGNPIKKGHQQIRDIKGVLLKNTVIYSVWKNSL